MSNYTQSTNFATKDALSLGNPLKIVRGTEINTEFVNISTAITTKADLNSPILVAPALGTPVSGNLANCTFPTLNQSTTGNASTATKLNTASGSAASFSARAFVAFNPSAAVQFATGGVSSITILASRFFQVNFSNNMPDTNYTIVCTSSVCSDPVNAGNQGVMMQTAGNTTRLVSSCQIRAVKDEFANPSVSAPEYIGVAIFR